MDNPPDTEILKRKDRLFTIAIPALAFGGILVAISLQQAGLIPDAGNFAWGCVIASFLLGYFAYLKPRKDVVSLCAPLYGVIIFLVPLEYTPSLLLQVLFAVSITILLVRLNIRFGSLADKNRGTPMEKFLHDYIDRIKPDVPGITRKTAHEIASAFLAFKFGLYGKSADECRLALSAIPEGKVTAAVKKALQIVQANSEDLENSLVTADSTVAFTPGEKAYAAIVIPDEKNEDPASLELDNALILIYAIAMITSPDDEQSLEEHQNFIIKLLSSYKTALGIV